MAKTYKAAIIGLGGFSRVHGFGFTDARRIKLIAGCDLDPARHAAWIERVGEDVDTDAMEFYTDAERMLSQARPDVVAIATKHDQHAPLTMLCAAAGVKGVICEKPIAMDLAEADAMIAACRKAGTKLAIGHQRRFNQEWLAAKKLIDDGAIGKVVHAISRWPDHRAAEYSYAVYGGGPLMWLSIHSVDLLRFILGDVRSVMAQLDMARPDGDTETRAYGVMRFKSGAQVALECGPGIGPEASLGHSITFFGEEGTVQASDGHGCRVKTTRRPRWREVKLDASILPWPINARAAITAQAEDMVRAIEKDESPRCDGKEARADLEVVMAMYESELAGGLVKLPLKKAKSPLVEINRKGGYGAITWPAPESA